MRIPGFMRIRLALRHLLAAMAIMLVTPAGAETPPAALLQQAPGIEMRGSGTLRWFGLRIYDAVLWTTPARPGAAPAAGGADFSRPLALQLRYARNLSGTAIAERSTEEIGKLGLGTPAQRAQWDQAMRKLFPDVSDGTTLAGLHLPGRGARFFLNGRLLGEIADAEFSQAFFSIWLDARTSAPELRTALLGPT